MRLKTNAYAFRQISQEENARYLSFLACRANHFAHNLTGPARDKAFAVKDAAISRLFILGGVVVNCRETYDVVGLDILSTRQRLHARLSRLSPKAKAIARRLASSAPAMTPMSSLLNAGQISLLKEFPLKGRRAA